MALARGEVIETEIDSCLQKIYKDQIFQDLVNR